MTIKTHIKINIKWKWKNQKVEQPNLYAADLVMTKNKNKKHTTEECLQSQNNENYEQVWIKSTKAQSNVHLRKN